MAEYNPSKIIKDGNTYNFRDTTKIPLAGSNQISGSLIPATDNSIDIGSSTNNIKMLYAKGITIDGKTVDTDVNGNMTYDGHIVDTIEEQGDGYIRYSNGLQICWGVSNNVQVDPSTLVTIQVSYKAFKSNPSLSLAPLNGTGGWAQLLCSILSITPTYANISVYNNNIQGLPGASQYLWQAIGRWK